MPHSLTPSMGVQLPSRMRTVCLTVAMSLLALPVAFLADGVKAAETISVPAPDYVWDGRLASDVTREYVWDGRLASNVTVTIPALYVWDGRLAGTAAPDLALAD